MRNNKKLWLICGLLLLGAFGFRLFIALRLATDVPDDGRVYAQIARNVLEQHIYSHESESPYVPSLIRLPGYPLLLAGVYAVSGHGNNAAVRVVQATIDTATCGLIALVAFQWTPDEEWKRSAVIAALSLAAVCPFTAIYVGTILTEVPTNFLAVAMVLLATLAFNSLNPGKTVLLWFGCGVVTGLAVLFRPDSGLFAAAIGLTILLSAIFCPISFSLSNPVKNASEESNDKLKLIGYLKGFAAKLAAAIPRAAIFSVAFCLVLVPWTIRNYRVFHLFQPLSPTHGEMPGEFVPRGYLMWLRTWLDDGRYIGPVLWSLDASQITIDRFPATAFDSIAERERVAALLEKYNHPPDSESEQSDAAQPSLTPDQTTIDQTDRNDVKEEETEGAVTAEDPSDVEMTPDIDAKFAQLARERIARAPFRYYVALPIKRAQSLWFDTHSQYYPFEGELFPLADLDRTIHQQIWLPLFSLFTFVYTSLGVVGAWCLLRTRNCAAVRWVLLAALLIFLRLGFFASLENPEPRYTVEIFPFLIILGGTAMSLWSAAPWRRFVTNQQSTQ